MNGGRYRIEPLAGFIFPDRELVQGTVPLYRLYNRRSGDHFYTSDEAEKRSTLGGGGGWVDEGVAGYLFPPA